MNQDNLASKMELSGEFSQPAEPVITPPLESTNADQATVLFNPFFRDESSKISDYRFLAYVRTGTSDVGKLCLALSKDGQKWLWWAKDEAPNENDPVPVLSPGTASGRLNSPQALYHSGMIYLWYSPNNSANYKICLATTTDGYTFSPSVDVLTPRTGDYFDSWTVQASSALVDYSNIFKMWYIGAKNTAGNKEYHLGLAQYDIQTGKLLSRTDEPLFPTADSPLPDGIKRIGFPRVIRYEKQYLMFFCGATDAGAIDWQIYAAVSDDGFKWTLISQDPVLAKGQPDSWNGYGVYSPSVLARGIPYDVDVSDTLVIPPHVFLMYFGGINGGSSFVGQTGVTALPFSEVFPTES